MKIITKTLVLLTFLSLSLGTSTIGLAQPSDVIPHVEYPQEANPQGSKLSLVKNLPNPSGGWTVILGSVIQLILTITGALTFIAFTAGGVLMVTARGDENQITQAKTILFWSIVAIIIISVSYAVVVGLTQLRFFQ